MDGPTTLTVSVHDGVALVELCRPEVRNRFDHALHDDLVATVALGRSRPERPGVAAVRPRAGLLGRRRHGAHARGRAPSRRTIASPVSTAGGSCSASPPTSPSPSSSRSTATSTASRPASSSWPTPSCRHPASRSATPTSTWASSPAMAASSPGPPTSPRRSPSGTCSGGSRCSPRTPTASVSSPISWGPGTPSAPVPRSWRRGWPRCRRLRCS